MKPVSPEEYEKAWKPHRDNPEIEVNPIDGKMRTKPFDPFEDIARRARKGEFKEQEPENA